MKKNKLTLNCMLFLSIVISLTAAAFADPLLADSYFISWEASQISRLGNFFVASSGKTPEDSAICDKITQVLSSCGYNSQDFSLKIPNLIILTYNITNEVRKVEVYVDESSLAGAAKMYKVFSDAADTFHPDLSDYTKRSMVRSEKASLPVEAVTISAYILQSASSMQKVWEGGAVSVEGTSKDIMQLTIKALANFPHPAAAPATKAK